MAEEKRSLADVALEIATQSGGVRHNGVTAFSGDSFWKFVDAYTRTIRNAALDEAANECSHRAFLCHTHDEHGKGRERGMLDCVQHVTALKVP